MVQTQILNNPRKETYGLDDDDDDLPVRMYDQPNGMELLTLISQK